MPPSVLPLLGLTVGTGGAAVSIARSNAVPGVLTLPAASVAVAWIA